jgi:fumarylacetoacetate (FAA) hydrolase
MKLATRANGTRDGQLMVVSRDGQRMAEAGATIPTMQVALDHWDRVKPELEAIYHRLNQNNGFGLATGETEFRPPLPRAYEWIDGSAYINHVVLVRKARGAEPPETLKTDPLIYQGGSGVFLGPKDDIALADPAWGCDFESEVAVILGDTPQTTKASEAERYIRLIVLVNDISLRNLIPGELAKGFGFFQSKPASAFSPFAVTPDELGGAWQGGRVHLPLVTHLNGKLFGEPNAGPEMHFSFHDLIEHITKTRSYTAGTILGSGTVSNEDRNKGSSCLAEKRMIEQIDQGQATTPFLQYGDRIEIEMKGPDGKSIFGQIAQKVVVPPVL